MLSWLEKLSWLATNTWKCLRYLFKEQNYSDVSNISQGAWVSVGSLNGHDSFHQWVRTLWSGLDVINIIDYIITWHVKVRLTTHLQMVSNSKGVLSNQWAPTVSPTNWTNWVWTTGSMLGHVWSTAGSGASVLVPETRGHLQRSGFHSPLTQDVNVMSLGN